MCLSNFGVIGFLIAIISLPIICNTMDKMKTISSKTLALVVISALLTQCIDVYLIFVFFIIVSSFGQKYLLRLHIKFGKWRII